MKQQIQFSLVVPVLNEAGQIESRLQLLQPLRQKGFELLVVDGGSTDGSVELARPLVDQLLTSKAGRALQMNAGAAAANGEWLLFLHLDTSLPMSVESTLDRLREDPTSLWGWFDVRLDNPGWPYRLIANCMNVRARATRVCTGDQTLFVRNSLFRKLGGFPEFPLMEDIAMSKLLRSHARPRVLRPPVTTSSRRWEQNGYLATILLMWRLRLLYFLGVSPGRLVKLYYPAAANQPEKHV